jgi:Ca2+-binding EF-hand superfamily protein
LFFDKHDTSGDGKLQREEFKGVFQEMGIHLNQKQLAELYYVLDRDGEIPYFARYFLFFPSFDTHY